MRKSLPAVETELIDDRMIAAMRLVLASSALAVIYIDPEEPGRFIATTYGVFILYILYSASLYVVQLYYSSLAESISFGSHWLDIGWYVLLMALSGGTSSIFFYLFFFSVLVASFRGGGASGYRVVVVSFISFSISGYAAAFLGRHFELNKFLIRLIYLLVFGYMIAYWGNRETLLRRRLSLLKKINTLSNPRFGIDHTLGNILEQLCAFYEATSCVFIMHDLDTNRVVLRRAHRCNPEISMQAEMLAEDMIKQMLPFPAVHAIIYNHKACGWLRLKPTYYAFNVATGERSIEGQEASKALADLLEAKSYISVPIYFRKEVIGRSYIAKQRPHSFDWGDINFLLQAIAQFMPVIDNIRLIDRLASDAAEEERKRIARDIHDSLIQPYVGIQIGLDALDQKLAPMNSATSKDQLSKVIKDIAMGIRRLRDATAIRIEELRNFVHQLAQTGMQEGCLLPSVRRFAARFSNATGITVKIEVECKPRISDRLAAELFQMIVEGLANIQRHTHSSYAAIKLTCSNKNNRIYLHIENDSKEEKAKSFTPHSLLERVSSLGGHLQVEQHEGSHTTVSIEIPL